jgi:hypothetical protein
MTRKMRRVRVQGLSALNWRDTYRTNTVYLYSFTGPFVAECLCRLEYGAFTCCIRRDVVVGDEGDDAGDVDDFAWSLEREKLFAEFLGCDICRL